MFLSLLISSLSAQNLDFNLSRFNLGVQVNRSDDLFLGANVHFSVPYTETFTLFTGLYVRPFKRNVLITYATDTYFILKEYRWIFPFGLQKTFPLNNDIGIFGAAAITPTLVFYAGSNRDDLKLIGPMLDVGFVFGKDYKNNNHFKIGYRYINNEITRHGFFLEWSFYLD